MSYRSFISNLSPTIERLIIQSMAWQSETEILFDRIGIQPDWKCMDIGCGPVGVLPSLSKRVKPTGLVLGVDENPDYLDAAKRYIPRHSQAAIQLLMGNIYHPFLKDDTFDFCHSRFILNETGCGQELLDIQIALTKQGGVVASQESDWTTWKCYPTQPSWNTLRDAMIQLFSINGGDINAGMRTYQIFHNSNLSDINIRSAIMAMPVGHPYRDGLIRYAMNRKTDLLEKDILTEKAFDECIESCQGILVDQDIIIFSYSLTQVWGIVCK